VAQIFGTKKPLNTLKSARGLMPQKEKED